MSDDYGPYGKGFDGYFHYMQAFNESHKGGGGGGGKGPSSNGGCLSAVLYLLAAAFLFYALTVY